MNRNSTFPVKLFYSYCHKDSGFRDTMEDTLNLLEDSGLKQWSDGCILPGQDISDKIKQNMEGADIFVFLISRNFLASEECKKEWRYARELSKNRKTRMVPIIVRQCAWKDFENMRELMALPQDGKPVTQFNDEDVAWQQIYEGIKGVIDELRLSFVAKEEFLAEITHIDFVSHQKQTTTLDDLFVFSIPAFHSSDQRYYHFFDNVNQIINKRYALIYGDEMSGKTTFCAYIFRTLLEQKRPVMFVDLKEIEARKPSIKIYQEIYAKQFYGDFSLWIKQENRTVILDNLSNSQKSVQHLIFAKEHFHNVIVTVSSDVYSAYWIDDQRLADFTSIEIQHLSRSSKKLSSEGGLSYQNGTPL